MMLEHSRKKLTLRNYFKNYIQKIKKYQVLLKKCFIPSDSISVYTRSLEYVSTNAGAGTELFV